MPQVVLDDDSRFRKELRRATKAWLSSAWTHGSPTFFFPLGVCDIDNKAAWYGTFMVEGEPITEFEK